MYIYPYNGSSKGARELGRALRAPLIKRVGSRYRGNPRKTVINWGCTALPDLGDSKVLNNPHYVRRCTNKLAFFNLMEGKEGLNVPKHTSSREEAIRWLMEGRTVVARAVLNGSGGIGITVVSQREGR